MDRVKCTGKEYIKIRLKLQLLLIMYFCGKCNMFYRVMNDVHTRIVCCYRGRVGSDLSVLWVAY